MTQHEQKPESAECRTREDQIETMTVHYMEAGFPINAARRLARDGVAEAEARGAAEQRRKDAEVSKSQLFSNREQDAAERTPQREDVRRWQADQKEFFLSSVVEVVTEYAEWRDKKDAEGREPVAWLISDRLKGKPGCAHIVDRTTTNRTYAEYQATLGFDVTPLCSKGSNVAALEDRVKELEEELGALLDWADGQWCPHDNTHRGGSIWTICNDCGRKWADDVKPFDPDEDFEPSAIKQARAAIREGGE